MKGLILAAGLGSRLGARTKDIPKCMVELNGQPLLHWQLNALRSAGIEQIVVVCGYRHEVIEAQGLDTIYNPDWDSTNMVASLLCAESVVDGPVVVSYSDIVYSAALVRRLMSCSEELTVAYDAQWLPLWQARFQNPLSDAESFKIDSNERIVDIGRAVDDVSDIQGQYMGLICITPVSFGWIREVVRDQADRAGLDITGLLARLIAAGRPVYGLRTEGNWCEIDSASDLALAESLIRSKRLILS